MRKIDQAKPMIGMAAKTINFEKFVAREIERMAFDENTTVSKLVNKLVRELIIKPHVYYRELAKYHQRESMRFRHMAEEVETRVLLQ